ncbi:amidohydrolase [Mesorhizobium sp. CAU 1732]|uniref:amidohydrolase n=1 Tax=Mesorhizobium sp. CAU 1732 TaxID=3140358 RepID=UPI00325FF4A5
MIGKALRLGGIATALTFSCAHFAIAQSADVADAIFHNGRIITVDADFSVAEAFAVKDGKILAVGTSAAIQEMAGDDTHVTDLDGQTVIPGLSDGHLHSVGGGPGIDLSQTRSMEEFLAQVAAAAKEAGPDDILVSNNDWHEAQLSEQVTPTADQLEEAAPGIPLVIRRGGHSYFLNHAALDKWGITKDTPVPAGGSLPKNDRGELTGEVTNNARTLVPLPPSQPQTLDDLLAEQKVMNSYGLTSVRIPGTTVSHYRQLIELRDTDRTSVRYSVLFRNVTPETLGQENITPDEGDEWVRVWGIKMGVDGGFEGGHMTKAYEEPRGNGGTYFGLQLLSQEDFNQQVSAWNDGGWRVTVHGVGDAALDQILDGYEETNKQRSILDRGWAIEHAFVSRPDQYPRARDLNLQLSVQNHLYLAAPTLHGYWGDERANHVTPLKTYLEEGFLVVGGTDSAVIPVNPFWVLYHFISRDTISDGVYGEDEAISREDALKLLTINYAKMTGEEKLKGSIEPGKFADFVIISDDYLAIEEDEIENLRAVSTYVDGVEVYNSDGTRP